MSSFPQTALSTPPGLATPKITPFAAQLSHPPSPIPPQISQDSSHSAQCVVIGQRPGMLRHGIISVLHVSPLMPSFSFSKGESRSRERESLRVSAL